MTQTQWVTFLFKVFLVTGFLANALWILIYSRFAKWWTNAVGRTLVIEAALIGVLLLPSTLSLYFDLNRFTSELVSWIDVGLIGLIGPVMGWRCVVWIRLHRASKTLKDNGNGGEETPL